MSVVLLALGIAATGAAGPAAAQSADLAQGKTVTVSNVYQNQTQYAGAKAVDGNDTTRWATDYGVTSATLVVDFGTTTRFNKVLIKEYSSRITGFTIDQWLNNAWSTVYTGTTAGAAKAAYFPAVSTQKVRLNITKASAPPTIYTFGVYQDYFADHLAASPKDSGLKMSGYYVWDGSVIQDTDGTYNLFSSRWPTSTGFPDGYRAHSEIVRATSSTLTGPYTFKEVVLKGDGSGWDSSMVHNPAIVKSGNTYVLYHIASGNSRQIGYATATSLAGPWTESSTPIANLPSDVNNPAPFVKPDGSVLLVYRYTPSGSSALKLGVATAPSYDGTYTVRNTDLVPGVSLEDPYLWYAKDHFEMLVEDNLGTLTGTKDNGGHLVSDDGITWRQNDPVTAYTPTIRWTDGTSTTANRRERNSLVLDGSGQAVALVTAVQVGSETWTNVEPLSPSYPTTP
ncbi:MAG TPA: discoidin domain-containing protein [Kineosporiaceae bacterium]|nr:discoidin domain-containing protein [Kineosporiaceae bacterium]